MYVYTYDAWACAGDGGCGVDGSAWSAVDGEWCDVYEVVAVS